MSFVLYGSLTIIANFILRANNRNTIGMTNAYIGQAITTWYDVAL